MKQIAQVVGWWIKSGWVAAVLLVLGGAAYVENQKLPVVSEFNLLTIRRIGDVVYVSGQMSKPWWKSQCAFREANIVYADMTYGPIGFSADAILPGSK